MNIFSKDGFIWWIGVVEDVNDPEKLGRVRIRIFGYHGDDKEILKTEDLPWALPVLPITSAGLNGIGSAPVGTVPGTWVIGFFLDGKDMQQPAFFGVVPGYSQPQIYEKIFEPKVVKEDRVLVDEQGNPTQDEQGNPIPAPTPSIPGWYLGKLTEIYESGNSGPGLINDYLGAAGNDPGGASYGIYQFISYLPVRRKDGKARINSQISPVKNYILTSIFKNSFYVEDSETKEKVLLSPATPEFDNVWKQLAKDNSEEFRKDQRNFALNKYFFTMSSLLRRGDGNTSIDVSKFGPAVKELVFTTAIYLGPNKTDVFFKPLKDKAQLTDRDIVELVTEYKIANVSSLVAAQNINIARARFQREKNDLIALLIGQS